MVLKKKCHCYLKRHFMSPLITTHMLIWELHKLVKLQICQCKWTENPVMLGSTLYWLILRLITQEGWRGWRLLLIYWLTHYYKVFSQVCDFLPFDYQKQQHFPLGNYLYCSPVTAVSYSLIFIGRLYAKCKSNLLLCHDNSPLTLESWRGTPNKTE